MYVDLNTLIRFCDVVIRCFVETQTRIWVDTMYNFPSIYDAVPFPTPLQAIQLEVLQSFPVVCATHFCVDLSEEVVLDGFQTVDEFLRVGVPEYSIVFDGGVYELLEQGQHDSGESCIE